MSYFAVRNSLRYFFLGVVLTTVAALGFVYGMRESFKREAYEHYAGIYYWDDDAHRLKWSWFDDYYRAHIDSTFPQKFAPPPTPQPKLERL